MFKRFFNWIRDLSTFNDRSDVKQFLFASRYNSDFTDKNKNRRDSISLLLFCIWGVILECVKIYCPIIPAYVGLGLSIIGIIGWKFH